MEQRHIDNAKGIFIIWLNWVIAVGAILLTIVLSLWVKATALPLIAFGFEIVLFALIKRNREARVPICYLLPFVATRALFWSAVVMIIINIMYSRWFVGHFFDPGEINLQIPFIAQLILAPITLVTAIWARFYRKEMSFCRDCKIRFGTPAERGFLGKLFTQEANYQMRCLIVVSAISTVLTWSYYFMSYVNVNLSKADKFFFVWNTVLVFIATVIYLGIRYLGLWSYYCHSENRNSFQLGATTKLRYIMLWDDYVCLQSPEPDADSMMPEEDKTDTPVKLTLTFRQNVTLFDARRNFEAISGLSGTDVRFMYSTMSTNADCNIFHYLCFLTDEQKARFDAKSERCHWYKINEVAEMINSHAMAPIMSAELMRLHSITMSWKTYTPEGKRRYKIKNYKPTFRLRDIKKSDVDYNDHRWLFVAHNNEDTPFYRLRCLWRKYVNGIGD